MADNPFEDPDVQAAAQSDGGGMPPPVPQDAYGDDNAYDDDQQNNVNIDMVKAAAQYIPPEQQKQIAVSAGSAMANQAANNEGDLFPGVFIRAPRFVQDSIRCEKIVTLNDETVGVLQGSKLALTFHPELTNDRRFHRWLINEIIVNKS